jgi:hypothetical protein
MNVIASRATITRWHATTSFTLGRFCSADPVLGSPGDPQSWNRYVYVRDNPVNITDPSGLSWLSDFFKFLLNLDPFNFNPLSPRPPVSPSGSDNPWSELDNVLQPPMQLPAGGIIDESGGFGFMAGPELGCGGGASLADLIKQAIERFHKKHCHDFVLSTIGKTFHYLNERGYAAIPPTPPTADTIKAQQAATTNSTFESTMSNATVKAAQNQDPTLAAEAGINTIYTHPGFNSDPAETLIHETFHLAPYTFSDESIADALGLNYATGKTQKETIDNASAAWDKQLNKHCGKK